MKVVVALLLARLRPLAPLSAEGERRRGHALADIAATRAAGREAAPVWAGEGGDSWDSIQAALSSGAPLVTLAAQPAPWVVSRPVVFVHSHQTLYLEPGAELLAMRGRFHGLFDSLVIAVAPVSDIRIVGYNATLRMWREDYANASKYAIIDGRHGIFLGGVDHVTILGLTVLETGG